MAEFLVMARSNTDPDPIRDGGKYKRGDIVAVMPDGTVWGRAENPAGIPRPQWKFVIVRVPGLSPENNRVQQILNADHLDVDGRPIVRKLWRLVIDDVPAAIRNQLLTTGTVTVTLTQIRNFIRNKLTEETM